MIPDEIDFFSSINTTNNKSGIICVISEVIV